jgi:hypothetical protein
VRKREKERKRKRCFKSKRMKRERYGKEIYISKVKE